MVYQEHIIAYLYHKENGRTKGGEADDHEHNNVGNNFLGPGSD